MNKYLTKTLKWNILKNVNNSKFINTIYIWIFLVPILLKSFEMIDNSEFLFTILGQQIPIKFELPFSLILFYFSALCFAIANLLFKFNCPNIILDNDFLSQGKKLTQLKIYIDDINMDWSSLCRSVDDKIKKDLIKQNSYTKQTSFLSRKIEDRDRLNSDSSDPQNYFWNIYDKANTSRVKRIFFIGFLYLIGFILFGIVFLQNLIYVLGAFL